MPTVKACCFIFLNLLTAMANSNDRPNVLIITVDDMNADSIGAYGCQLSGTTPNIDRLARGCLRFTRAHVQVGNCMPSRNVMWSGLYPHNNRVEGFYQVKDAQHPTLATLMRAAGYFTAIRHKVSHSTPYQPYPWDLVLDSRKDGSKAHAKDPGSYGRSTTRGIEAARKANKPFCLMINIADPHKPFYGQGKGAQPAKDPYVPSRIFKPQEVPVPGFLFDDPVVRNELAMYYSSVRRSDDAVGSIVKALNDSGATEKTFVMFLSDHGMPFPFAKTQLYHHSTWTPLMVRWPGTTRPNTSDSRHMVSAVDFLPTILDVAKVKHPEFLDGRSFARIIQGESQENREQVIKVYNENAGGSRDPMRAVQTRKYLYLFNPWSNGTRVMATATTGTQTYRQMVKLAESNEKLQDRLQLYKHRVVEELYDVEKDPDCLVNLIAAPQHADELAKLRQSLEQWMIQTRDHMLPAFQSRGDPDVRENYVVKKEKEADERRKKKKGNQPPKKRQKKLIQLELPQTVRVGQRLGVTIRHQIPKEMGEQSIHVTLKAGKTAERIKREVIQLTGRGEATVEFVLPEKIKDNQIRVSAFVGTSYPENLQYLNSDPLPVTQ
ncbi:MAG: sulfatase [Planctomycetota bacterium]|nr:sulfatase [Planctomycetota bacterium]